MPPSHDGYPDVITGAHNHNVGNKASAGKVLALGGKSGQLLWAVDGTREGENLGLRFAAVGDVDGDGVDDVLVGAPGSASGGVVFLGLGGRVAILSGATGATLVDVGQHVSNADAPFLFGQGLSNISCPDAEGWTEIAVSLPLEPAPWAKAFGMVVALRCKP